MLFQRVGNINPQKQQEYQALGLSMFDLEKTGKRNKNAPTRKGIWAFPWPCMDMYFTSFQPSFYLPKHLRSIDNYRQYITDNKLDEDPELWYDKVEEWIRTKGKKELKVKSFWAEGPIYTRFTPKMELLGWDEQGRKEWFLMDIQTYYKTLKKMYMKESPQKVTNYRTGESSLHIQYGNWSSYYRDHLEVFIPSKNKIT